MADQADGAFNPSRYLTKVSGNDYLETKWRLLWLRTEHPDATIDTELTTLNGDSAIFRAKVAIPDGGSATGWGSETYNDFRDFIEKAETKALGRALAALGYGTQFCDDFGEGGSVTDSPVKPQAQRQQSSRTTTRPEPTRQQLAPANDPVIDAEGIRLLHAKAANVKLSHDDVHAIAVHRFPGITSINQITGSMLFNLNKLFDDAELSAEALHEAIAKPAPAQTELTEREPAAVGENSNAARMNATPKQLQFISAIARELNLSDESLHMEAQASFGSEIADLTRRDASVLIERLQQRRQQSSRPIGSTA